MRVLIVSNLYPPYYHGGYELRCKDVAERLHRNGHKVRVLTSTYEGPSPQEGLFKRRVEKRNGITVQRVLNQYVYSPQPTHRPWTLFQAKRELADVLEFFKAVKSFRPDVINWWSLYGLSKLLLPLPLHWGIPDVHWIEHWWLINEYGPAGEYPSAFWNKVWDGEWGPPLLRPLLRTVGHIWERRSARRGLPTRDFVHSPRHVCFVSEHMSRLHWDAGFKFPSSEIIYGGVPIQKFYRCDNARNRQNGKLNLLYAGQITHDRGLHTIVEALGSLDPAIRSRLRLRVAGGWGLQSYMERILATVERLGLAGCVDFLGKVPHEEMPRIYHESDVLVFPSLRDEGLPLAMVEAMLAGCAVITTGSGGAMEVASLAALPLFPKNDFAALGELLNRSVCDQNWLKETARRGQRVALQAFTSERMMQKIEAMLLRVTELYPRSTSKVAGSTSQALV